MEVCRLLVLLSIAASSVCAERILAVWPFFTRSHFIFAAPVFEELARRGHEVTVVSRFPRETPMDRYTDIDVRYIEGRDYMIDLGRTQFTEAFRKVLSTIYEAFDRLEKVFQDERIQDILNSKNKFDLVITEPSMTDMYVGFSHKLKVPLVEMIPSAVRPWVTDRFAIPDNPSYIRASIDRGAGSMSFYEKIINIIVLVISRCFFSFISKIDESVSRRNFGVDVPHVSDMIKTTSLLLTNSHFSINGARPYPPNVVEIGGVHIKPAKPLPKDIEEFLNESEHGVVYFSMGSFMNASSMTETTRKAFCNSFAKLKQRVLWKWELDELPGKPDNVKIVKWMPQRDVLAHQKVRVFVSHGGLLGTMEGVYNEVPMIGIPVMSDQHQNIGNLVNAGSAILLDLHNITEESVTIALNAVLEVPKYKMNAQRLSRLFRDRPLSPMDTAIYWIEYVMRHNGAQHLRSAAVDLSWYQYLLLDVIVAFIIFLGLITLLVKYTVKLFIRTFFMKRNVKRD